MRKLVKITTKKCPIDPYNDEWHYIDYADFVEKLIKKFDYSDMDGLNSRLELCHAAMGVAGEAGELCDALKKVTIYGKPPDRNNIVEELGDLMFFMQDIMNKFNISDEEILQANADKLSERYKGLEYSDKAAIKREDKTDYTQGTDSIEGVK